MPKVVTYRGQISLTGESRLADNEEIYKVNKFVYGETLGTLLDNMVNESVIIAQDLKTFLRLEMPTGYRMSDDYWSFNFSHPALLEATQVGENRDNGSGGSVSSVKDIVVSATHSRHLSIMYELNSLNYTRSEMKLEPLLSSKDRIMDGLSSTKFATITASGFQGTELDKYLAIVEADGSLEKYRRDLISIRRYRETERKQRVHAANRADIVQGFKEKINNFFIKKAKQ
jgi:hypothetical protein